MYPIPSRISGTVINGCIDCTQSTSRSVKTSCVYGGGSAASASEPLAPHGPTTHSASPKMMPNPAESRPGPSVWRAEPRENRLVTKCMAKIARSDTPKITQVVGWTNAAAIPVRNTALRAPHDSRAGSRNASSRHRRNSTVMLSR